MKQIHAKIFLALFLLFWISAFFLRGQIMTKRDSLWNRIKLEKNDSVKIELYVKLKNIYLKQNHFDSALYVVSKALTVSNKFKLNHLKLYCLNQKAFCFERMGKIDSALIIFNEVVKSDLTVHNYREIASAIHHIGATHYDKGDYNTCLTYYQKRLEISIAFNDTIRIRAAYSDLGNIYLEIKRPFIALEKMKSSQRFLSTKSNNQTVSECYFSLGTAYLDCSNQTKNKRYLDSANYFLTKSINASYIDSNFNMIAYNYSAIGTIKLDQANYDSAIYYFEKSIQLRKDKDLGTVVPEWVNLLCSYKNSGNNKKTEKIANEILGNYYELLGYIDFQIIYDALAQLYEDRKEFTAAFKFMRLSKLYSDSVFSESASEKRKELEMNFEFKRTQDIQKSEQDKKDIIADQELKEQKRQRIYFAIGLLFAIVFSVYIFLSLKKQRSANKIISGQKREVEEQKHLIEEHQKEIIDSIRYAQRIQQSLMPTKKYIEKTFSRLTKKEI